MIVKARPRAEGRSSPPGEWLDRMTSNGDCDPACSHPGQGLSCEGAAGGCSFHAKGATHKVARPSAASKAVRFHAGEAAKDALNPSRRSSRKTPAPSRKSYHYKIYDMEVSVSDCSVPRSRRRWRTIPRLVDLFMAGRMPLHRLISRYDFADINRAAADATSGAAIKPVLLLPQ